MGKLRQNLLNKRFGKLLVTSFKESLNRACYWNCLCDCGKMTVVQSSHLNCGGTVSCGCHRKEKSTTHGMRNTPEYKVWASMIARCYNPKEQSFEYYGERGIKVCDTWLNSFENFYNDMGGRPSSMSLDRIDVNGDYEKENCKWATVSEQAYNKRKSERNKSGKTGVFWCKRDLVWISSISINKSRKRLYRGINYQEAVLSREQAEIKYYGETKE